MADYQVKTDLAIDKFGIVWCTNEDGTQTCVRILTKQELDVHRTPRENLKEGENSHAAPAGLTQEEWDSGRFTVLGWGDAIGDLTEQPDGTNKLKYAHRIEDGEFVESHVVFAKDEAITKEALIEASKGKITDYQDGMLTVVEAL